MVLWEEGEATVGELTKKLTVKANAFSQSAKQKIEACGGRCVVI